MSYTIIPLPPLRVLFEAKTQGHLLQMRQSLRVPPSWPTLQRHFEKRRSSVAPSRPDQRMILQRGEPQVPIPTINFWSQQFWVTAMFWESRKDSSCFLLSYKKTRNDRNPHWNPWMPANRLWAWITWAWEAIITWSSIRAWGHIIQLGQDLWFDSLGTKPLFNKKRQSRTEQVSQPSKWLVTLVTGRRRCQKHSLNHQP